MEASTALETAMEASGSGSGGLPRIGVNGAMICTTGRIAVGLPSRDMSASTAQRLPSATPRLRSAPSDADAGRRAEHVGLTVRMHVTEDIHMHQKHATTYSSTVHALVPQ